MVDLRNVGVKVGVGFWDGGSVEGWLWGETAQGLLIAMDRAGTDIRLFTQRWMSIGYNHDDLAEFSRPDRKEIADRMDELNRAIAPPLGRAMAGLDFAPLQRASRRLRHVRSEMWAAERELGERFTVESRAMDIFWASQVKEAVGVHASIYDELENRGIPTLIAEHASDLARLPSEYALPALDGRLINPDIISDEETISRRKEWSPTRHREMLERAESAPLVLMLTTGRETKDEQKREMGRAEGGSRWAAAGLRIIAGTGLIGANSALWLTVGLGAAIVSLGATAIPSGVAVATSIYTGLTQAADGLEKVGGIIKDRVG
jgi:hypothetical protein